MSDCTELSFIKPDLGDVRENLRVRVLAAVAFISPLKAKCPWEVPRESVRVVNHVINQEGAIADIQAYSA